MRSEAARRTLSPLVLLVLCGVAHADIQVNLEGVDGDVRGNVLAYLSVERYRERTDLDEDTVRRLFNRIDGEVKGALRPYGYYAPQVAADYRADGADWVIDVRITPGDPVRVRELAVTVEGPGAQDAAFAPLRTQTLLRVGMRLNHGTYEQVKGELTRVAAANGYLAARLVRNEMLVDPANLSARIDLALDTGPRYRFGEVAIDQKVIRPDLMRRFLRFKEGDPYTSTELLRTQFALDDSLYFSSVDVEPGAPDPETLTVPVRITASKSHPLLSIGGGYGTDTQVRGTLGWSDTRINDRGHRLRFELKASASTRRIDSRYDIPIGDPAVERLSFEGINRYEELGDVDTTETTVKPSVTRVRGRWQTVTSVSATRTTTKIGTDKSTQNLLVPGIVLASVPEGFLGEALFSRGFYGEVIGSHSTLGSDADFLRVLVQGERVFDLDYRWHLQLRGELGTSLVSNFSTLPAIYRFFAGGDRSVRGFAYQSLSPEELVLQRDGSSRLQDVGGRHMVVGSVELVRDLPWSLAGATFFDIGNAFDNFGDKLEYAAGVGIRYRLPVVSIGLDVAKPLSTGGNVRFHLNITPKL